VESLENRHAWRFGMASVPATLSGSRHAEIGVALGKSLLLVGEGATYEHV
jgi:hypothetical protein